MPNFEVQMTGPVEPEYLAEEAMFHTIYRNRSPLDADFALPYPMVAPARIVQQWDLEAYARRALEDFHDVWMRFIDPNAG